MERAGGLMEILAQGFSAKQQLNGARWMPVDQIRIFGLSHNYDSSEKHIKFEGSLDYINFSGEDQTINKVIFYSTDMDVGEEHLMGEVTFSEQSVPNQQSMSLNNPTLIIWAEGS